MYQPLSSRLYPLARSKHRLLAPRCIRHFATTDYGGPYCEVEAEPVHRYKKGGYHPVHLGDRLADGRYTVLHKLGWGGYATVWLARDERQVLVSELLNGHQEASILRQLSQSALSQNIIRLLDTFKEQGPNGEHICLVTELTGPSIPYTADTCEGYRLPGKVAWTVARQVIQGIAHVHRSGVVHGDLHPGNIALTDDTIAGLSEAAVLRQLGKPWKGDVHEAAGIGVPRYLVSPSALRLDLKGELRVKLMDFGSAFPAYEDSPQMRCPLPFRAPESMLFHRWDAAADLWSLGCTIFSLVVGFPPFDSIMTSEQGLVSEWLATFGDVPTEWRPHSLLDDCKPAELETADLSEWLRFTYFDNPEKPFFTEAELATIGDIVCRLLRYRPAERLQLNELQRHPMFHDDDPTKRTG